MATLIPKATGNLTSSTVWATADNTSLLDSEAANTALTTSYVTSSTFTPGAITIDGIAVKIASRATGSPANTISVALDLAGVTVVGTEITINVSDINACSTAQNEGGWYLFKFAAPVLLVAVTLYSVKAKLSATTTAVNLYTDSTAANWSRMLRTTTISLGPATGDVFQVIGEHTGAATGNSFTVTMDNTATTDFGPGTDGLAGMTVGKRGTVTWGTSASTNYYLKLSGSLIIYSGGTWNRGTVATAMPRNSSGILEFDPVADGGMGFEARNVSTIVEQGLSRTLAKNIVYALLNSNAAANATSLSVDTDTGWLDNDEIVVVSTSRTATETEKGALNGNAGASSLTVDGFAGTAGGILNAHSGTSPTQGEVILLTRNLKTRSATSTIMAYMYVAPTASVDIDWVEFYYLGENVTNKRGIEIATTTGSCSIQYSSVHDTEDGGVYLPGAVINNITFSNNVTYNLNTAAGSNAPGPGFAISQATTGTNIVIDSNIFAYHQASNTVASANRGVNLVDIGITFTNNRVVAMNGNSALTINDATGTIGTFSNIIVRSGSAKGLDISNTGPECGTISNLSIIRQGDVGLYFGQAANYDGITFASATLIGNATANIDSLSSSLSVYALFNNLISDSDSSFSTASGLITRATNQNLIFFDSSFGASVGHTQDINVISANQGVAVILFNTILGSATEVASQTNLAGWSFIRSHKNDQSTAYKNWYKYGTILANTSVRHTASGFSWELQPVSATKKLNFPGPKQYETFKVVVNASSLVTIKAFVRKSAAYNGNAPRLILLSGVIGGVSSNVTASLSVGVDTWEELTVTGTPTEAGAMEFVFDCDGTAGSVYIDDVTVTQ